MNPSKREKNSEDRRDYNPKLEATKKDSRGTVIAPEHYTNEYEMRKEWEESREGGPAKYDPRFGATEKRLDVGTSAW